MRLVTSILIGFVVACGVAAALFHAGFKHDLLAWGVAHFLWLQDCGLTTIDFHNQLYSREGGPLMMLWATVVAYGLAFGLLIWLFRRASASDPRQPDVRTHGEHPTPPEGHGRYHGLSRGSH